MKQVYCFHGVRVFFLLVFLLTGNGLLHSQCSPSGSSDFEFWFGVPVWGAPYNSPQTIHFTGADTVSSCYIIDMPADTGFIPIGGTVAAGGSAIVDLTSFMGQIITTPADTVLNRGLRVRIWGKASAYYANENGNNYGTMPLRGPNSLGTSFIVPGQNLYGTGFGSRANFVVTATEDSTLVQITPSDPIVGHGANTPFSIRMNKGQSYQARAVGAGGNHLGGSTVASNNVIVVTYCDDLMGAGGAADNGGDQLVPINKLGNDYVHIRTNLTIPESVFLTGTKNGTTISVFDGTLTTILVVHENETKRYDLPSGIDVAYIHSDKPIVAYQLGGAGAELGSGVLTPVEACKGTDIIAFQYPATASMTYFNFIVPAGFENGFIINGDTGLVTVVDFQDIPGFPGWRYCRKNITATFSPGTTVNVRNTQGKFFFYQNLYSFAGGGGGDFSNFSDFGNMIMFPRVEYSCGSDTLRLNSRSIAFNTAIADYSWSGPNGFSSMDSIAVLANIAAADTGWYVIELTDENACVTRDSVYVPLTINAISVTSQPSMACEGSSIVLSSYATGGNADSIRWSGPSGFAGSQARHILPAATSAEAGTYYCRYYDQYGCYVEDSTIVSVSTASSIPGFAITGSNIISCNQPSVVLSAGDYVQGISFKTFAPYRSVSLYASADFDSVTTGFYSQMPTSTGTVSQINLSGLSGITTGSTYFGVKFWGYIKIDTAGTYTFYTNSYDGSNLFIDGTKLVSNDGTHALTEVGSLPVSLSKGYHAIEVTYFKGGSAGSGFLSVSYQGPGIAKTVLPSSALFYAGGVPPAGLSYTWYDVNAAQQLDTGMTYTAASAGIFQLKAASGCESYKEFKVENIMEFDYSDLPTPWPVAQAGVNGCPTGNGIPSGPNAVWAGTGVSPEYALGTDVAGDSYDDGLSHTGTLIGGVTSTFSISLNANQPRMVFYGMWIDWNNNGDFTDDLDPNGNYAFYQGGAPVMGGGVATTVDAMVLPPLNYSFNNYKIRLVVSDDPIGFADFGSIFQTGEVEDYEAQSIPLILGLTSFKAEPYHESVLLSWVMDTEVDVDHYRVEWSPDQADFRDVGLVDVIGGTGEYRFLHIYPVYGMNFYRLKIVGGDGYDRYSEVRAVQVTPQGGNITVSPNPLTGQDLLSIKVYSSVEGKATIEVFDQYGREVLRVPYQFRQGINQIAVDLGGVSSGIYYVKIRSLERMLNFPVQKVSIKKM